LLETLAYRVAYEVLAFDEEIVSVTIAVRQGSTAGRRRRRVGRRALHRSSSVVRRAYFSLGSNLGDRREHLAAGVDFVRRTRPTASRRCTKPSPVGGVVQDPYWNLVIEVATDATAAELLARAHRARRRRTCPRRALGTAEPSTWTSTRG